MKAVKGTIKLHAVFPYEPNWIWVKEMLYFCADCFSTSFRSNTSCKAWRIANLDMSIALERVESNENHSIITEINEHVTAVYPGKVTDVDDPEVYISFYQHGEEITNTITFRKPKRDDQIWMPVYILFTAPICHFA